MQIIIHEIMQNEVIQLYIHSTKNVWDFEQQIRPIDVSYHF